MYSITTRKAFEYLTLLIWGGWIYYGIELIYRGHSHWTMAILGGLCFIAINAFVRYWPHNFGLVRLVIVGVLIVTWLELIAGIILNIWLGMAIWDYSMLPLNFMGQVSLIYSLLWTPLVVIAIFLDDWLRYILFDIEKPTYKWF